MNVEGSPNPQQEVLDLLPHFDTDPNSWPWRFPVPDQIEDRRLNMNDVLIFDLLLASGGIPYIAPKIYPPRDLEGLKTLLLAILVSTYDALKKDCLIYFLLKWHQDGREVDFSEAVCIPPQFVALADAYWHLDSGVDIGHGVGLLSDVRLNREHTSKILQALALADDPGPLIRRYIRTAKPLLTSPVDLDVFIVALAGSSLREAWQFQRSYSEMSEARERLFCKMLEWCFVPKPRATPLKDLLALPLSQYEENILHAYAADPPLEIPSVSIPVLHDLVCLRLVQAGEFSAAVMLERKLSARSTSSTSKAAHKAAQERRQMMDDIMAAMPAVERQLLELELEQLAQGKGTGMPTLSASWSSRIGNSGDLSMSWESVRTPLPANGSSASAVANASRISAAFPEPPPPSLSQRSGAPRFGGPLPVSDVFSPLSLSAVGSSHASSAAASTSAASPILATSISASRPISSAPRAGPSTPVFTVGSNTPQSQYATPSSSRPISIFETLGSANRTPNAFYTPPVSAGVKRSFGEDTPRAATSGVHSPVEAVDEGMMDVAEVEDIVNDEDVEMHADGEPVGNGHADPSHNGEPSHQNGVTEEVSFSMFSPPPDAFQPLPGLRSSRTQPETQTLPGAFTQESDEESEPTPPPPQTPRKRARQAPPQRSPSPALTRRTTRTRKVPQERISGRSIPGSLMDDDDEEEEDVVPPLPPPTPATKRGTRKTKTTRANQDDMSMSELRPRRSTRLSSAASAESSSEEPMSPQKPSTRTRSTRKPGVNAPAKNTRKKRS